MGPDSCMGLREVISASDALDYYSYGFTLVFSDSPPSNNQVHFLTIEVNLHVCAKGHVISM